MPILTATRDDLPPAVAAALADPAAGTVGSTEAAGVEWPTLSWGHAGDPPLLLVHGVTSNAGTWWRVGPALAASGRRVTAIDMPGHGKTAREPVSHRFADTATALAEFIRVAGLERPDLAVIGHSWGGMVTAHLPGAGIRPAVLVLLDPPVLTLKELEEITRAPSDRPYATVEEAAAALRAENPTWSEGDVAAKAVALTEFDPDLVLAVLVRNGAWDGGMAALRDDRAAGVQVWLIRGDWETGGLIPDTSVPAIASQLGPGRVITIAAGPHSPHRTHPEATILAILRALGG